MFVSNANDPRATLSKPLVSVCPALNPTTLLLVPVVTAESAPTPCAVFCTPVVNDGNAEPNPTLLVAAKSNVSVDPDPANLEVAFAVTMLILPAVGLIAPPVLPVIVCTTPVGLAAMVIVLAD